MELVDKSIIQEQLDSKIDLLTDREDAFNASKGFSIDKRENTVLLSILKKAKILLNWGIKDSDMMLLMRAISCLISDDIQYNNYANNVAASTNLIKRLEHQYNIENKKRSKIIF